MATTKQKQAHNGRPLFIFCGGESRRLGRDKALLEIGKATFLTHLVERVENRFSSVALLSNGRSYGLPLTCHHDAVPGSGPLGGLLTAMNRSKSSVFSTITVDAPLLSDRLLDRLSCEILPDSADAAVIQTPTSIYPLSGIFRTRLRGSLLHQIGNGQLRVVDFIRSCNVEPIPAEEHEINNINTEADYNRLFGRRA